MLRNMSETGLRDCVDDSHMMIMMVIMIMGMIQLKDHDIFIKSVEFCHIISLVIFKIQNSMLDLHWLIL